MCSLVFAGLRDEEEEDGAEGAGPAARGGAAPGDDAFESPEQISDRLVTLSLLPTSRWQNLLNLDVIKVSECTRRGEGCTWCWGGCTQ